MLVVSPGTTETEFFDRVIESKGGPKWPEHTAVTRRSGRPGHGSRDPPRQPRNHSLSLGQGALLAQSPLAPAGRQAHGPLRMTPTCDAIPWLSRSSTNKAACLVVSKPPGVLTQAPPGIDSLEVRIKAYLGGSNGPDEVYLGVPHRLDRPASGAIVFAKDLRTTRKLGAQFENREFTRSIGPVSKVTSPPETGRWEDFLYKVAGEPRAEVVGAGHPEGRPAALHYRVLKTFDWGSWLEIELETGRTHQIRIQAASRGHPVLGDNQYGSTVAFGPQFEDERLQAIALARAEFDAFATRTTRQTVTVIAPVAGVSGRTVELAVPRLAILSASIWS